LTLKNKVTGAVLELPHPDAFGQSTVRVNGKIVEHVLYSDENGEVITLGDGRTFDPQGWSEYIVQKLGSGEWK
jgi:hypothetical protein